MPDPDFDSFTLGEDKETLPVESSAELREASHALLSQCARTIEIVSRHLDPVIYDNREFAGALRRFLLDHRRGRVHIIIMDTRPILAAGHRLIDLAQQLSSYIEVRRAGRKHADFNAAFLIADRVGTIHRPLADRFEGEVNFGDRRIALELGQTFDEMWAHGEPDPNLRRLSI